MENSDRFEAAQSGEARYRLLVEAITDYAIYMLDRDGHVTSWNPGAKRFKGYEAEEIIGRHFSTFYTETEREQKVPALALEEAERTGRFEREGWRVRKDGTQFWAHVVIDAIRSPKGELVGFAKITRDLTERRAAEAKLRESEQQFRLMVQSVTDYAIYMLDVEGNVASWNAGAQRIKGYGPEEIIGRHFSNFYTEEDRAAGLPRTPSATGSRAGHQARRLSVIPGGTHSVRHARPATRLPPCTRRCPSPLRVRQPAKDDRPCCKCLPHSIPPLHAPFVVVGTAERTTGSKAAGREHRLAVNGRGTGPTRSRWLTCHLPISEAG
ncbi:PAS domain S-box-containing protein [Bradyrhizobium japonicum]|nr:PAS domain S-box-containing protein [Bradyrhizobium japonicum]MCS3964471.1 PAS domain S-box-containing protein [Bradyrhizobium japonicum]MCS3996780.1 PAS domain S-box-containing protein [Bradyrhizobium japonicum]